MGIDDSFTKPGSVPFKWEIRPGVPKTLYSEPRRKQLQPPPAGSCFRPHLELRPDSPQQPRSRRFGLAGPDVVSATGCFPSPTGKTKTAGKRSGGRRRRPEQGYYSDPDVSSGWSVSSRKSAASPSSSFASYQSSPRPINDAAVWAGFGLF